MGAGIGAATRRRLVLRVVRRVEHKPQAGVSYENQNTIGASSLNPLPHKFRSVPERDLWLGISRRVAGADARRSRWEGD